MSFTYKGLSATLDRHIVTTEEIDRYMQRMVEQNPRIAEVTDRPTQLGDEVVLDYAGFCDGEQFAGGTAEMQTLTLGSGMFIPGFEEQLVDKVPGEEVTVSVTFPTEYHSDALAGKAAEFKCKIHQIRIKSHYELDDTFAKEVGGCETLAEMHKKLGESMQAYADQRGEMDLQDRLLRMAADTLEHTFSAEEIEATAKEQVEMLGEQLAQQGLSLELYCQYLSTTTDTLLEEAKTEAMAQMKTQATVDEIVRLENLEATAEELAQAKEMVCRQNHITMEQLQQHYSPELEKAMIQSVLAGKVMHLIRENAVIS